MELVNKQKVISKNNSFPKPKKINCFECQKEFEAKFVISRLTHSQKNNWGFWTGKKEDDKKYYCNECIRQIYSNKETYWQAVQNSKKRALFRVYLHNGNF